MSRRVVLLTDRLADNGCEHSNARLALISIPTLIIGQFLNRLAIELRDYAHLHYNSDNDDDDDDVFHLFLSPSDTEQWIHLSPPIVDFVPAENLFAGESIQDVETFAVAHADALGEMNAEPCVFIGIDEQAMIDGNCILFDRILDDETEDFSGFHKARIPRSKAWSMQANLSLANVDFEDYCPDADPEAGERWYTFDDSDDDEDEKNVTGKKEALDQLARSGHI
ncbi:hypothetical protein ANO11243_057110 [Dothideomycetidae sp. 11243]|nr:hypothetical protein ANO11243_057110 [fungal sp. No.11243]